MDGKLFVLCFTLYFTSVYGETLQAQCVLVAVNGSSTPSGTIQFSQECGQTTVKVTGQIRGLSAGDHGFHVHATGDISNNCLAAGPHLNPFNKTHGGPTDEIRHVGDLGNIVADDSGVANVAITDSVISMEKGDSCILNKAMVLHAKRDDLGKGGNPESLKTGNAGPRLACCVIT